MRAAPRSRKNKDSEKAVTVNACSRRIHSKSHQCKNGRYKQGIKRNGGKAQHNNPKTMPRVQCPQILGTKKLISVRRPKKRFLDRALRRGRTRTQSVNSRSKDVSGASRVPWTMHKNKGVGVGVGVGADADAGRDTDKVEGVVVGTNKPEAKVEAVVVAVVVVTSWILVRIMHLNQRCALSLCSEGIYVRTYVTYFFVFAKKIWLKWRTQTPSSETHGVAPQVNPVVNPPGDDSSSLQQLHATRYCCSTVVKAEQTHVIRKPLHNTPHTKRLECGYARHCTSHDFSWCVEGIAFVDEKYHADADFSN